MNGVSNYAAIKKAIDELAEVLGRSQPGNKEASKLLGRMNSVIIELENLENKLVSDFASQRLVASNLVSK